jgi:hypothetical protein
MSRKHLPQEQNLNRKNASAGGAIGKPQLGRIQAVSRKRWRLFVFGFWNKRFVLGVSAIYG